MQKLPANAINHILQATIYSNAFLLSINKHFMHNIYRRSSEVCQRSVYRQLSYHVSLVSRIYCTTCFVCIYAILFTVV